MTYLKNNIDSIHKIIEASCKKAGRSTSSVTLICVSKTVPPETILKAKELGETVFGENRPQELREKFSLIPDATWHLIGHLQTNKVKYVVGKASLIHSVDSLHLAEAINENTALLRKYKRLEKENERLREALAKSMNGAPDVDPAADDEAEAAQFASMQQYSLFDMDYDK